MSTKKTKNSEMNNINEVNGEKMNKGLRPSKGNMYDFVTHTLNPVKGKCEHGCAYCYMSRLVKNPKPIRLVENDLKGSLGSNYFIFVGSSTDLFAKGVKSEWIIRVLDYCNIFENKYLFQTKNPERLLEFIKHPIFTKSVICTTIETNRYYADCKAPTVEKRVSAIEAIKSETDIETYVTIEPIMDFDLPELVDLIKRCNPVQVNIGADSKRTGLPEPNREQVTELVNALSAFTKVKEKKNLNRLMQIENLMETELKQAKKEVATSKTMTVQVMERTENGYTIKEENRKFGLVKENRPIKKTDVNGFLQIIQNGKYDDTQSIVTAEATELIENYNIVDLEGNPISAAEASQYLIVLDGQHRISAFAKINAVKEAENQITIPNVHIKTGLKNVREYLADINMVGHSWSTADKVCVSAIASNSKLLDKSNELIKEGFNPSTAITICIGKRLKPAKLKEIITKGDTSDLPEEETALARAEKFITTAMGITDMTVKILTKRYFINGFNAFAAARTEEEAFKALGNLTIEDFTSITEDNEFTERLKAAMQPAA